MQGRIWEEKIQKRRKRSDANSSNRDSHRPYTRRISMRIYLSSALVRMSSSCPTFKHNNFSGCNEGVCMIGGTITRLGYRSELVGYSTIFNLFRMSLL